MLSWTVFQETFQNLTNSQILYDISSTLMFYNFNITSNYRQIQKNMTLRD